jgi:hypothetical protein
MVTADNNNNNDDEDCEEWKSTGECMTHDEVLAANAEFQRRTK